MAKLNDVTVMRTVGVVEKNSLAYIQAVFEALRDQTVVVPLRSLDDDARKNTVNITATICPVDGGGWYSEPFVLEDGQAIAHISFTSGTEGEPKGVLISANALNDVTARVQSLMCMNAEVKEYVGVPIYHSFGYGRCRHVASVGGAFYIPSQGFDPKELSDMLRDGAVNALSLVPTLLRVLLNTPGLLGDERYQLRWLEIGSQAMSAAEKIAVKNLFPNAIIVQHYGLTEASRTTLLRIDNADDTQLDSVGYACGDVQLMINDKGCICIRGPHVASQLLIHGNGISALNDDGWLETTDLGHIVDGCLYYEGRADNVVNCGGQKLSTERLESAIAYECFARYQLSSQSVDDASSVFAPIDFAVSRILDATYGEGFLLSYSSEDDISALKTIAPQQLPILGINAKNVIRYHFIDIIPKTPTGKVQHSLLLANYHEQFNELSSVDASSSDDVDNETNSAIKEIYLQVLGLSSSEVNESDSVTSIGVDSLQSVQLSIKLEVMLGDLPPDWREQSIASLTVLSTSVGDSVNQADSGVTSKKTSTSKKAEPLWDGSSNRNPSDLTFWALLKEDFITHERDFFSQGLFALFVHRLGNWRMGIKTKILRLPMTILYRVLRKMAQILCGIKLDYTVLLGRRVKLEHFGGMIIGARAIGDDTILRQNVTMGIRDMSDLSAKPTIEKGVNVGAGAVIVGDITVGRYSVIGPNSVVVDDVPPFSVVSAGITVVTDPMASSSDKPSNKPSEGENE